MSLPARIMVFRVTQCPSCESTFNTSPRLLDVAAGRVRCGACLAVFEAAEHFTADPDEQEEQGSVFVGGLPHEYFDPSDFLTRHELRDALPPEDDFEPRALSAEEQDFLDTVAGGLGENQGSDETEEPEGADKRVSPQASFDLTDTPVLHYSPPLKPEEFTLAASFTLQTGPLSPAEAAAAHEAPAGDSRNEEDLGHAVNMSGAEPAPPESAGAGTDDGATGAAAPEEPSIEAIRARVLQSDLQDEEALERLPSENLSILERFSTPVELIAARQRAWRQKFGWSAVALLAGLLLLGQYLWQERGAYSQVATLRPLYQTACQWLGCTLPVYTNIDAIRSETLAVRSHPRVANALQANITFRNTAPFPQPFPILILSFNSASNAVIALREFAPGEYLQEGLRDIEMMPVGSPVQVDLELIDPGTDAVNYTMAFRRP